MGWGLGERGCRRLPCPNMHLPEPCILALVLSATKLSSPGPGGSWGTTLFSLNAIEEDQRQWAWRWGHRGSRDQETRGMVRTVATALREREKLPALTA